MASGPIKKMKIPYVDRFAFRSGYPVELPIGSYGAAICIAGLIQGIGKLAVLVNRYGDSVTVTNILTGAVLTNDYFKATVSTNGVQISSIAPNESIFVALMTTPQ